MNAILNYELPDSVKVLYDKINSKDAPKPSPSPEPPCPVRYSGRKCGNMGNFLHPN